MEKKITKREVINTMLADVNVQGNEMYVAYLKNELALLDKKAERKGKSAEEVAETVRLQNVIKETLDVIGKGTISEIQKAHSDLAELSNQKVTSLVKGMITDGVVVKSTEKGKSIFTLA